jgi:rod shape-determining protein MreD
MVRGLIGAVAVALAVVVQLAIVNRIAFPGGAGPDLVLLTVAALALASGPLAGTLIGFWAGLALDVAPPGSHFVGQNALVFCLIGYACGLVADAPGREGAAEQGHTALFEILVTAAAAVCGEALSALLGAMLSDPRVTWSAIARVLPVAALYDVLLCPFVLYAVAAVLRLAGASTARAPGRSRRAAAPSGLGQAAPLGGTPGRTLARREPRLRLGQGGSAAAASLGAAFAGAGTPKVRFGAGRGGAVLSGSRLGGAAALNPGLGSSRFGPSRMGRSLLGGSVFNRAPSALRSPSMARTPAAMGRSAFGRAALLSRPGFFSRSLRLGGRPSLSGRRPRRGGASAGRVSAFGRSASQLRTRPGGSAAGLAPRLARPGRLARLTAALRPARRPVRLSPPRAGQRSLVGVRSPGRGWLRRSSFRRTRARRGLMASGPARLHMGRSRFKRRWRIGGFR